MAKNSIMVSIIKKNISCIKDELIDFEFALAYFFGDLLFTF